MLEVNLGMYDHHVHPLNMNVEPCAMTMLLSVPGLQLPGSAAIYSPDHTTSLNIMSSCWVTWESSLLVLHAAVQPSKVMLQPMMQA